MMKRHARRLARTVPGSDCREKIARALDGIREIRKRTGRVTIKELLSARNEGRKD
jgi:hypothetical protein